MLVHGAFRSLATQRLFDDWAEACELWARIVSAVRVRALALMPDHVHVIADGAQIPALRRALQGYAQWRNWRRGERGQVWERRAEPVPLPNTKHQRRSVRYVHLNPCRAGLVDDPLAWPFSTHRDAVGLAYPAARSPVPDSARYHAWISGDPSTAVEGTPLPSGRGPSGRVVSLDEIVAAVSAIARMPVEQLTVNRVARRVLIQSARVLTAAPPDRIAQHLGVHASTIRRTNASSDPQTRLVERVLGDPRFWPLDRTRAEQILRLARR